MIRDAAGLAQAIDRLAPLAAGSGALADGALVALFVAVGALLREESRGGHFRADHPQAAALAVHGELTADRLFDLAGQTPAPRRNLA
ncbi:hypothetical protein [Methylobrevis pamukkalensis]|uniref:L-aspartate oxidase n=1 Tax=Methylobrevis pamukkalensis TaxID=1439726 RepID=A0A1E3H823_9HYPH|nr:hypothetical protein [Methylobrevis pamukkalensis]ODN72295.1 L-aspartate oxidase [Methylobrevis pamukkalensis]